MNLYTINTGYFKLDGGAMFGVVPKNCPLNLRHLAEDFRTHYRKLSIAILFFTL
jgi:hypothetical protein